MSKIVPLSSTCEYLVSRAASHRRAGRYDEAMALLTRAKETYGSTDDIEFEAAQTYEAMDCEEEAARCYLRIVRMGGKYLSQALFQLALSSAQQGEIPRAASYFERFMATDKSGIQEEYVNLLGEQLRAQEERPSPATRRQRARRLEQRASARLQEGKAAAAKRTMEHALKLRERAQGHTLLACCCLVLGKTEEAVRHAERGHQMAKGRIQALCILADAYACAGMEKKARRAISLAAVRAKETEDLFSAAIEAAKHGMDELVLQLTHRVMKREPFHTKAMMIRAAALLRRGSVQEANRLYGRLCGLLPESMTCEAYFRMTQSGMMEDDAPAGLGLEVTPGAAGERLGQMIAALAEDELILMSDPRRLQPLCRIAAWAMRSQYSGQDGALMAILLMNSINHPCAQEVLLDALTDPQLTDSLKMAILQVMTGTRGIQPYYADIGGRLVRLAAGASAQRARAEAGQSVVQAAADRLMNRFPDAPAIMLPMWVAYLDVFGVPKRQEMQACTAALELLYHEAAGHRADAEKIAGHAGVSLRACRYYAGRIRRAAALREARAGGNAPEQDEEESP